MRKKARNRDRREPECLSRFRNTQHIVKSVVEKPDEVQIDIQVGESETTLAVKVGEGDMGR